MQDRFIFQENFLGLSNGQNEAENESVYVRRLQEYLNRTMGTQLPLDGVMNFHTRRAIRNFELQKGMPVSKFVSPQIRSNLNARGSFMPGNFPPSSYEMSGEQEYEAAACPPFTPVAVANPGGGRIRDKKVPGGAEIVTIQGAFARTPLHRIAADALRAMVCAARADGIRAPLLLPTGSKSGLRDPRVQQALWETALRRYGSETEARRWVAKPGFSPHQSGRAIDLYLGIANDSGNAQRLRQTVAYRWLVANARRFGFYPYQNEPWHWEYNPPAAVAPEFFSPMNESFEFEGESETGKQCPKDWCGPDYIQWVQKSLNQITKAGERLREDGFLDSGTSKAIKKFQKSQALKVDGEAGPNTEKALISKGVTQPPQQRQLPCLPTKIETLISKLNKYRGSIPLHILLGWIKIESGGQNGTITNICERGYFQIHSQEAKDHKINNHPLLSYDEDHSIQSGIKLINYFVGRTNKLVKNYGLPNQGDVYWLVVKLYHWIPSAPETILADMQARGVKPASWDDITSYALAGNNRNRLWQKINRDPQQGINNANKMLREANIWLKKLQANRSPNKEYEHFENEYENLRAFSGPPLIGRPETVPPAQTLYVNIKLGDEHPAKPMTGIFLPQRFQTRPMVDLIIYLHGVKTRADLIIQKYWNAKYNKHFAFREGLNASGKNAILVAPTLGPRSQGQTGWLTKPGGLDKYLAQVLEALVQYGPYKGVTPQVGNIILACHSGGGRPMRELALAKNNYSQNIKECWGFDCTYFDKDVPEWPRWASARPDAKLYLYFRPKTPTQFRALKIEEKRLPNISVLRSSTGHNFVPITHWRERLQGTTFLT